MSRKKTSAEFVDEARLIHNERYDYSLAVYTTTHEKVKIICKFHGVFEQTPSSHWRGVGCPTCRNSKGELKIKL